MKADVAVLGGGPAGLAAAVAAKKKGAGRVVIIERDVELGGILNQCIHNGFGLHYFGEELTGPEYAARFIKEAVGLGVEPLLNTMAIALEGNKIYAVNADNGYFELEAGAVVLATGCRERTRGAIGIPGDRPSGIFTAGSAQRYVNLEGYMIGKRVLILGSGDIGLIMARRLTLEGARVLACVELMPYSNGLARNVAQCLEDFGIPLYLSHTITQIIGDRRVEKAVVSRVDEQLKPVKGTEIVFDVDAILLSVGLIPENELAREAGIELDGRTGGAVCGENMETSQPGVFACGNAVHVHDLVDYVTEESIRAGEAAASFARGGTGGGHRIEVIAGENVSYAVPQRIAIARVKRKCEVFFRVRRVFEKSSVVVRSGGEAVARFSRARMAPGEMEKIALPRAILDKIEGGSIEISAEDSE